MKKDEAKQKKLASIIGRICDSHDADAFLFAGPIYSPFDQKFTRMVCSQKSGRPNVYLMLETPGGVPDTGFQMMRCLQRRYKKIVISVHSVCASTGTLMAIGADEIVMSDSAQLGPLDIQVRKHDEIGERSSGMTPIQALNTLRAETFQIFENHFLQLRTRSLFQLTTKTCASIAARLTIGTMQPVYGQIDPIRLGEIQRAMMITHHYGERLARQNLKDEALEILVSGYPSHSAIIDRDEAKALFRNVRSPSKDEAALSEFLVPLMIKGLASEDEPEIHQVGEAPPKGGKRRLSGGSTNAQHTRKKTPKGPEQRGPDSDKPAQESEPKPIQSPSSNGTTAAKVNGTGKSKEKAGSRIGTNS